MRRILAEGTLLLAAAVVLGMTGPFGTYQLGPWSDRIAYWLRTAAVGYALGRPALWLGGGLARRAGLSEAIGWAGGLMASSAPIALWLWYSGPAINFARRWPHAAEYIDTYAQVLLIGGLLSLALWVLRRPIPRRAAAANHAAAEAPETSAAPPTLGPGLAERLPARLGVEVIALEMEDHYVRVHTRRGQALVLMRMADATADVVAFQGLRVHRSWWVARAAVAQIERQGRRTSLKLDNGLIVPVARDRAERLREAGWLPEPG